MSGVQLGSFALDRPIGEGGMAVVWSATRQDSGAPAAVKVLTAARSATESYRAALRNEVRAAAGLEHPHIVLVLDYGEVSPEAADRSGGALVEGTPWLAMEYAQGGALRRHRRDIDWSVLRGWLLALLSALGHAHARGVIHRDIKPANLLLSGEAEQRPGLKVTDFGLAYAAEWSGQPAASAGTPAYMAPEQRAGRVRDYGPWTDLYAVGRTALALLTGSPGGEAAASAQLPEGFTGWLGRLLAPEPADRFQRAADAAWALAGLEGPLRWVDAPLTRVVSQVSGSSALSTMFFEGGTVLLDPASDTLSAPPADTAQADGGLSGGPLPPVEAPPVPVEAPLPAPPPPADLRSGPRLAPLRRPPLLGREAERAALWSLLRAVSSTGASAAVLLEGPAGVGKSRLARWLCEAAEETGAARTFRALHSPDAAPGVGLAAMLGRALAAQDLGPEALLLHLEERLAPLGLSAPEELRAAAALISPAVAAPFARPAERYALARRLLLALAGGRPAVVWLDDVQWSPEALDFVRALLAAPRAVPVLFVLTAQDESLAERPAEAALVAGLRDSPRAQVLRLGPLPAETHGALVEALLGFESHLARSLARRTAGNPLFAVQLVCDWAQRGVLEPGPGGWRLAADAHIPLPDSLYAVWTDRLGRLVRTPEEQAALELAATLGAEVRTEEWAAACAAAGLGAPPAGLVERLLEQRLAEAEEPRARWAFPHAMARESLTRASTEQGRHVDWHRACAQALITHRGSAGAERIGHHLLSAGEHAAALPWLLEGAEARRTRGDHALAHALLERYDGAAQAAGLPPEAPARGRGWALAARIAVERGEPEQARALVQQADPCPAPDVQAQRHQVLGRLAHQEGRVRDAIAHFQDAVQAGEAAADPHLVAAGWALMAGGWLQLGALDEADRCHQAGLQALGTASASLQEEGRICYGAAGVAIKKGRPREAIRQAERALHAYEQLGHRVGAARCLNLLGEAARAAEQPEAAEAYYRKAVARFRRLETWQASMPLANLGLLLLEREDYSAARASLQEAVAAFEERQMRAWAERVSVCLLPCDAADGDTAALEARLLIAERLLAAGASAAEWALPAQRAVALLSRTGRLELAARTQRLLLSPT